MPSSRIPSPARSQGARSTPRRLKPRASRSVGSPARSTSSVKLTTVLQMDSLALSPMPTRRSVLTDTTCIDTPRRKSWWKKLDENSREIMEVLNNKDPAEANNAIEEFIDVDVLSQEKKIYTMDIPESSDGESISSIVIPQRKLFTQKESNPQKKFAQMIDNRESLAPIHKTQEDNDKTLNVGRKNLFSQGTKQRTKPLFPSALLNVSTNKTIANKTKELAPEPKGQVKSLFGNVPGTKRKNMFADFIVSDSEDEIPDIQPKVFEFQKKAEQKRRKSLNARAGRESHLTSPTSSITDIEIDDWKLLPSSTMVDHQLEAGLRTTPYKGAKVSKISEATETVNTESNATPNKTKQSNKSLQSKSKSKNVFKEMDVNELIDPETSTSRLDAYKEKSKSTTKNLSHEQSLKEKALKNKEHSKSKNVSSVKTLNEAACEDNVIEDKNTETNKKSNKTSKTLSKIDQVLQSDDDEDFSLLYENDDNDDAEHEENRTNIETEVVGAKENSNITKLSVPDKVNVTQQLQNKSKSQNIIHQTNEIGDEDELIGLSDKPNNSHRNVLHSPNETNEIGDEDELIGLSDKPNNSHRNVLHSPNEKKGMASEFENKVEQNSENNSSKCNKNNNKNQEILEEQNHQEVTSRHDKSQESNRNNTKTSNKEDEDNNKLQNEELIQHERHNVEVKQTQLPQDEVDNIVTNNENKHISINQDNLVEKDLPNAIPKNNEANTTRNSTYKQGQKLDPKVTSPEAILNNKTSQMESFTVQGRNTSVRKTKSISKNLTIRPSLAPVRESTDFSNGSKNSSVEESGWDSHRTTRATLRQTFGKDFTPRKSLRALVMEKSAKRRTYFTENNAEISRLPQANSTELPGSAPLAMDESNNEVSSNKSNYANTANNSGDAQKMNISDKEMSRNLNDSDEAMKIPETNSDLSDDDAHEMNEVSHDNDDSDEEQEKNESDEEQEINESDNEKDESDQAVMSEINDFDEDQIYNESDQPQSDNEQEKEIDESDQRESNGIDDSDRAQNKDESGNAQEMNDCNDSNEMDEESEHEITLDMDDADNATNKPDDSQEMNQSGPEFSHDNDDGYEEMDDEQEMDESDIAQEMNESGDDQDINEVDDERDVDESENAHEMIDSDHELSLNKNEEGEEMVHDQEDSRKTRQTTLEMYLQELKKRNIERKKQLEEEIRNSIKPPTRDMINPFKVPAIPKLRRIKPQQPKTKTKPVKSSAIPLNMLPAEILEDMKYKPPKRYRPTNASWVTKRLYKFLETKLEAKYDYKARVRSEKLVETIYNFTKDIRRHSTAPPDAVRALKHEMAQLDIVKTHHEFYEFFHEYMPREVKEKVVPDVFNKISLPKHGVFSDILR